MSDAVEEVDGVGSKALSVIEVAAGNELQQETGGAGVRPGFFSRIFRTNGKLSEADLKAGYPAKREGYASFLEQQEGFGQVIERQGTISAGQLDAVKKMAAALAKPFKGATANPVVDRLIGEAEKSGKPGAFVELANEGHISTELAVMLEAEQAARFFIAEHKAAHEAKLLPSQAQAAIAELNKMGELTRKDMDMARRNAMIAPFREQVGDSCKEAISAFEETIADLDKKFEAQEKQYGELMARKDSLSGEKFAVFTNLVKKGTPEQRQEAHDAEIAALRETIKATKREAREAFFGKIGKELRLRDDSGSGPRERVEQGVGEALAVENLKTNLEAHSEQRSVLMQGISALTAELGKAVEATGKTVMTQGQLNEKVGELCEYARGSLRDYHGDSVVAAMKGVMDKVEQGLNRAAHRATSFEDIACAAAKIAANGNGRT